MQKNLFPFLHTFTLQICEITVISVPFKMKIKANFFMTLLCFFQILALLGFGSTSRNNKNSTCDAFLL